MLRYLRCPPAQQGQLPGRVPNPLWRCKARQPTAASLPLPRHGGTIDRLPATHPDPRPDPPRAAPPRGALASGRLYRGAGWAALGPYAAAAELLTDVLPIASGANRTTVRAHALRVA